MANTMDHTAKTGMSAPKLGLMMGTALAGVALSGCTSVAPPAEASFSKAQVALEKGQATKAIAHAEAAVLAEPRNPGFRAILGAAYLEAGRFQSATTSFNDAMDLGDEDPRTVLSYALAKTAMGENAAAIAMLSEWEGAIDPADMGLALALAGQPERGVHVLINTLRSGQNNAKVRQNLAYTYALAGNWRAAKVMVSEDVPAGQVDARLAEWAATARPEDQQLRVAGLLNVTPVNDGGQPVHLALSNFPSQEVMIAEAAARADEKVAVAENTKAPAAPAPKLAKADETVSKIVAATASSPAPKPEVKKPAAKPAPRFVSNAVVQKVPTKPAAKVAPKAPTRVAKTTTQRRMAVATGSADTHLVQLGSFSTRPVAEAKWADLQSKFPELRGRDVVITEANVKGKTFFRVAAAGFTGKTARAMCGTAKSKGLGCFAYAASNPPAGAVDRGVRIAARTR